MAIVASIDADKAAAVRLVYHRIGDPELPNCFRPVRAQLVVHGGVDDGATIVSGDLWQVERWLRDHGFAWVAGSAGLWAVPAPHVDDPSFAERLFNLFHA